MTIENTVHLKTLFPLVLPFAPRANPLVAATHMRESAIRFCEETRCWREGFNQPLPASADITLDIPDYASTHAIEYMRWHRSTQQGDVVELEPIAITDVARDRYEDSVGEPRYFTQIRPGTVRVIPREGTPSGALMGTVFLRPRRAVLYGRDPQGNTVAGMDPTDSYYDRVPDYVADRHGASLAHGALSTLLSLPEVNVRDDRDASYYSALFQRDIAMVMSKAFQGEQRTPIRSRAHLF